MRSKPHQVVDIRCLLLGYSEPANRHTINRLPSYIRLLTWSQACSLAGCTMAAHMPVWVKILPGQEVSSPLHTIYVFLRIHLAPTSYVSYCGNYISFQHKSPIKSIAQPPVRIISPEENSAEQCQARAGLHADPVKIFAIDDPTIIGPDTA